MERLGVCWGKGREFMLVGVVGSKEGKVRWWRW